MNKQLRKYFPKNKYLNDVNKEKVREINITLNSRKLKSLDGYSPEEAFIRVFREETFKDLFK